MTTYGLTDEGFFRKPLSVIKTELEDDFRDVWPNLNLSSETPEAQEVGIYAERLDLVWEQMEEVYNSQYPGTARGTSLENVGQITGSTKLPESESIIEIIALFGTIGTPIPQGTQLAVGGSPTSVFGTDELRTLIAGVDEIQKITPSAVPDSGSFKLTYRNETTAAILFSADAAAIQAALRLLDGLSGIVVTGTWGLWTLTFSGDDGKQVQPLLVVPSADNTLLIGATPVTMPVTEDTAGVYQGSVSGTALNTGPTQALFGTLTEIVNPISGFDRVKNMEDADLGRDLEEDPDFRIRREEEVEQAGAATVETIRAGLLDIEDVEQAIVFENDTSAVDSNGLPPKSLRAYVRGGTDQEIGEKLWEKKGGGIEFSGTETYVITDTQGIPHSMKFSRPTIKDIYVIIDILSKTTSYGGDAAVLAQVLAYGDSLQMGDDCIAHGSGGLACFIAQVAGITDFTIKWDFAPAPTSDANLVIAIEEQADFDSSRIAVNS